MSAFTVIKTLRYEQGKKLGSVQRGVEINGVLNPVKAVPCFKTDCLGKAQCNYFHSCKHGEGVHWGSMNASYDIPEAVKVTLHFLDSLGVNTV